MHEPVDAPLPAPPRASLLLTLAALNRLVVGQENPGRGEDEPEQDDRPVRESTPASDRWVSGYKFRGDPCDADGDLLDLCAAGTMGTPSELCAIVENDPFFTQASTIGNPTTDTEQYQRDRTMALLRACQHGQIGAEVWSGAFARANGYDTPYLASPDAGQPMGDDPLAPCAALGLLESLVLGSDFGGASCGCSQLALIHAPLSVVYQWLDLGAVRRDPGANGQLYSNATNNLIVTGPGYTGAGPSPDGEADGPLDTAAPWIYATGMIDARLGPVGVRAAVDRDVNARVVQATRPASATWQPCCHVGVAVELDPSCNPFPGGS